MTAYDKNDVLLDAMMKVAITAAYEKEIDSLPHEKELADFKPSPALDKRITGLIKKSVRHAKTKHISKNFGKLVASICILLTIASIVLMSVGATRNAIFNAIIKWQEKYTEIKFGDSSEDNIYRPTYLPEGFSEITVRNTGGSTIIIYENKEGNQVYFNQGKAENDTTLVDNENTDAFEIKISGNTAYLFSAKTEDDANMLIWQANGIVFKLTSVINSDELIHIGESVKK